MGEKITIIKHDDWFRAVRKEVKLRHIDLPAQKFEFALEMDKGLVEHIDNDPLLQQKIWTPGVDGWELFVRQAAAIVGTADDELHRHVIEYARIDPEGTKKKLEAIKKKVITDVEKQMSTTLNGMKNGTMRVIENLKKTNKKLVKYKATVVVVSLIRLGALGMSLAGVILSLGTNGFAWAALIKSCIGIAQDIVNKKKDLAKVHGEIDKMVSTLSKRVDKHPKLAKGAEVGNQIIAGLLAKEFGSSVSKLGSLVNMHRQKRLVLWKRNHNLAIELNKTLKSIESEKDIPPKLKKDVDKIREAIMNSITKIGKNEEILKKAEVYERQMEAALKDLKKATSAKKIKVIMKTIMITAQIGKAIALDLTADESFLRDLGDALGKSDAVQKAGDEANKAVQKLQNV